jgi:hypothetical protein
MFRRLEPSLPEDPGRHYAELDTFDSMGFFINEHDQIRLIQNPSQKFIYKKTSDDRSNEVRRDAFNCKSPVLFLVSHRNSQELTFPISLHSQ